ncbi:MAG: UvrB/UvrC motif-containing protein [bacterium]|jgi:excinuclease ABC subunit C
MPRTEPSRIDISSAGQTFETAPDRPAVFLVRMREGAPYLGRTTLLRRRLRRLFGERAAASRVLTLRGLAASVEYWPVASRLESMLVFYDLAAECFPETYLDIVKLRMPPYVGVLLANEFPRTQVTSKLGSRSLYYGPFRTRASAEMFEAAALELFQVRRCAEDLEPAPGHPGCIYGEMNMCLRPCQAAVSAEEYRSEVERLAGFLQSGGRSLIEPLTAARDRFSERMEFEEAARLHKRIEKVEQAARLRDELASDIGRLYGVAVTPSVQPGAVELWFVARGVWLPPVRFSVEAAGKSVSMDERLRQTVAALDEPRPSTRRRQEHLALLARWYYSSWRDGEWLRFDSFSHVPYRSLVRAISKTARESSRSES